MSVVTDPPDPATFAASRALPAQGQDETRCVNGALAAGSEPASRRALAIPEILELVVAQSCLERDTKWCELRLVSRRWQNAIESVVFEELAVHLARLPEDSNAQRNIEVVPYFIDRSQCWKMLRRKPSRLQSTKRVYASEYGETCPNGRKLTQIQWFWKHCRNITFLQVEQCLVLSLLVERPATHFRALREFSFAVQAYEGHRLHPHDAPADRDFIKAILAAPLLQAVKVTLAGGTGLPGDALTLPRFKLLELLEGVAGTLKELRIYEAPFLLTSKVISWRGRDLKDLLQHFPHLQELDLRIDDERAGLWLLAALPDTLQRLSVMTAHENICTILGDLCNPSRLPQLTRVPCLLHTWSCSGQIIPRTLFDKAIESMRAREHARYIEAGAERLRTMLGRLSVVENERPSTSLVRLPRRNASTIEQDLG